MNHRTYTLARGSGLLLLALGQLLAARVANAASGAVPARILWDAQANGMARVLVELAVPTKPEANLAVAASIPQQRASIAAAQSAIRADLTGTDHRVLREYTTIPFVALEASEDSLIALESSGLVVAVREDVPLHALITDSTTIVQADQAWAQGFDGTGQTVAIVDSGVDSTHPMLAGKVLEEACFSASGSCPNGGTQQSGSGSATPCTYTVDDCGHGTHVAGIAAGSWPSQNLFGVARGASIVAVQVFSRFNSSADCAPEVPPCALAYTSDIVAGLEHVYSVRGRFAIAAVNLSIGGGTYSTTQSCDASNPATKAAIDNLTAAGIAVAVASGNDGSKSAIAAPACISSAVSVGSTSASDRVSSFSNSASFLSLLAPGEEIESAFPGNQIAIASGTSEATPQVAGAWAILKQKAPEAAVATVLAALRSTGVSITDARNGVTTPRIQVRDALATLGDGSRQSGINTTPDRKRRLISKDVGDDRWSIVYDLQDQSLSGNVFPRSGGAPQFVFCERISDDGNPDPAEIRITYSCSGSTACADSSCSQTTWTALGSVTLPGSFLQP